MTAALSPVSVAVARQLGSGPLPIKIDAIPPLVLDAHDEVRIEGRVEATDNVVVVLRIDDQSSHDYASRFNGERSLPPGPFRWTLPAKSMKTATGRTLDHASLRRIIFFVASGTGTVTITHFEVTPAPSLPDGAKGYAFGSEAAELPAGFERIGPKDTRIEGRAVFAIQRPAPDPLVASGLRGVERVRLPWTGGRARVTLWTEDPGEWELLPHPLERRIRVNGRDVVAERLTAQDWTTGRYLRGRSAEHDAHDDAWTAFGRARGGKITTIVEPGADGLVIDLAGSSAEALFLSAVLVEPAGESLSASEYVEAQRRQWYLSNWPVAKAMPDRSRTVSVALDGSLARPLLARVAPDTAARLSIEVTAKETIDRPQVTLRVPSLGDVRLDGMVWAGQRRLDRRGAGDTLLVLDDRMLTSPATLPLVAGQGRRYEIWIEVASGTPPGTYTGTLSIAGPSSTSDIALAIEVLPVTLPPITKPAGYYLDEAPHLTWFAETADARDRQAACDLAFLTRFRLSGSAPPLATPDIGPGRFDADMIRARNNGLAAPWLAYAPAKRLLERYGPERSAGIIADRERDLAANGVAPPLWSLADEPSNPGGRGTDLAQWIAAIRRAAPHAKIAAQLNTPADQMLIPMFDTVLVNDGFGLDLGRLRTASAFGRDLWLYNTGAPRLTAGLWLWMSPAKRYLQWHARMPTADPFDPIDGREGDVQVLLPTSDICPALPTIDRSLLDLADGVIDQRWLAWLSAQPSTDAARLVGELEARVPSRWRDSRQLSAADLQLVRESIMKLVR